jgi:hypothetical protein
MHFRKLRIAWSLVCGITCVLLIVLWIRSYWRADYVMRQARIESFNGRIIYDAVFWVPPNTQIRWSFGLRPRNAPTQWFKNNGFVWRYPDVVAIPYWCPVLGLAVASTAPWVSRCRRFSLQTLLIVTTMLAVLLGLIVYAASK